MTNLPKTKDLTEINWAEFREENESKKVTIVDQTDGTKGAEVTATNELKVETVKKP